MKKRFFRYVSQNMLGMLGMSCYILADTYFISKAVGSNGITALNLVLPVYNLIFAIGSMIGVGSAIRCVVETRHGKDASGYFFHALSWALIIGLIFTLMGIFIPDVIIRLLGGDEVIVATGTGYTRIFMLFAPFFMWNYIVNAFVRNDGNPSIAMAATLFSSLFNIVFDYVLMFPLGLAMEGAALATALSPLVGILICMLHLKSTKCTIKFKPVMPSVKKLFHSCQVGVSAFVGEISSGVITASFNTIILSIAGNTGVAAYGVVANISLVAVALFNGIAQGSQPLISEYHGKGDREGVKKTSVLCIVTSLVVAVCIIAFIYAFTVPVASIFNEERDELLAAYAYEGLRIYFIGFLFAGLNIVLSNALSAVESVKWAFIVSISRGFVMILVMAFTLSKIFGLTGVWMAFPVAELITLVFAAVGMRPVMK